jgi:hypothetical protein
VIEDAILFTKRLNFRYLCIDRYCINEDNQDEKHTQIGNMDAVYSNAELTVVAAAGHDPLFGLPGVSKTLRELQPVVQVGNIYLVSSLENPRQVISNSKWMARGWTYQEGLLSRRRLIFTTQQVYFQCLGMHCFESISMPLSSLHVENGQTLREDVERYRLYPNISIAKTQDDWVKRINEYVGRSLSHQSDFLNAILGVLKVFKRTNPPIYHFWGIPFRDINHRSHLYKSPKWQLAPSIQLSLGLAWGFRGPGTRHVGFPVGHGLGGQHGQIYNSIASCYGELVFQVSSRNIKSPSQYPYSPKLRFG